MATRKGGKGSKAAKQAAAKRSEAARRAAETRRANREAEEAKKAARSEAARKAAATRKANQERAKRSAAAKKGAETRKRKAAEEEAKREKRREAARKAAATRKAKKKPPAAPPKKRPPTKKPAPAAPLLLHAGISYRRRRDRNTKGTDTLRVEVWLDVKRRDAIPPENLNAVLQEYAQSGELPRGVKVHLMSWQHSGGSIQHAEEADEIEEARADMLSRIAGAGTFEDLG